MSDPSPRPRAPRFHRPTLPGAMAFESIEGGPDPAEVRDAAERAAAALVRGTDGSDPALVARVVGLAETEGLDALADLWSAAPADSLAGSLWRLYLLRTWVHGDPARAAREYDAGRRISPVADVVAGVAEPPGPAEVKHLVDQVLAGVVVADFADVLFRAAAFARVAATGRASLDPHPDLRGDPRVDPGGPGSTYDSDLTASRLVSTADQLERSGHLELAGRLG